VEQRPRAPLADDEMRLDAGLAQPLQQPDAVDGAGCARDTDYQPHEKSQSPNPKTQIPRNPKHTVRCLGIGTWDLGFGIYIQVLSTECFVVSAPVP
jgi:hypothetical protein